MKAELTWSFFFLSRILSVAIKRPSHLLQTASRLNKPYLALLNEGDVDPNIEDSIYGYEGKAKFRLNLRKRGLM